MKTYLILLCLTLSACVTPGEMQRQREERTRAEWRAQNEADKEARRRASEEADAELSRLAQARQQDWIRQHRAAGGLLLTGVGRACAVQEQVPTFVQNLRALAGNTSCEVYSLTKAEVRLSFLNDAATPVKDLKFQCVLVAPSGTAVGASVTATIYDVWQPGEIKAFRIVMPAQEQMASARCVKV